MDQEPIAEIAMMTGEANDSLEAIALSKERWEVARRLQGVENLKGSEITTRLGIDRKTVRKALHADWNCYARVEERHAVDRA